LLVYSWDECDEGGNALMPTYTPGVYRSSGNPLTPHQHFTGDGYFEGR
jgi:hypothetical protein